MTIADHIPEETDEYTLAVVNREQPRPVQAMLADLFADQSVSVEERSLPGDERDAVYLLDGDGTVVASSPLAALRDCILLVNSDLYITGARDVDDLELPAVIERLDDVPFAVRGYPASHREKLLLITISRYVEGVALDEGGGTLRSSFQRLSRIDDERGTRAVYDRLGASGVETHVYGVPDWTPPDDFGPEVHGGTDEDYRRSWFVVHVPAADDGRYVALVAHETGPNEWDGFWTHRPASVAAVDRYIVETL
jgi:hypothetical protein